MALRRQNQNKRGTGDQGHEPYNSNKKEDFSKPKIMWKIIGCNVNFCYDEQSMICNNVVDIMVGKNNILIQFVGLMNSQLFDWYLKTTTEAEVQGGGIQLYVTTLEKTPLKLDFPQSLTDTIYKRIKSEISDVQVDEAIFDAYGLSVGERTYISNCKKVNRE